MSSVRRPRGRLFQIHGPTAPKLLSPKLFCLRGTAHMLSEEDRRDRRLLLETRCLLLDHKCLLLFMKSENLRFTQFHTSRHILLSFPLLNRVNCIPLEYMLISIKQLILVVVCCADKFCICCFWMQLKVNSLEVARICSRLENVLSKCECTWSVVGHDANVDETCTE